MTAFAIERRSLPPRPKGAADARSRPWAGAGRPGFGFGPRAASGQAFGGRHKAGPRRHPRRHPRAPDRAADARLPDHPRDRRAERRRLDPSPGSVYPTLQQLTDEGLVRSTETDGKRVYELTDDGRAQAESRRGCAAPWEEAAEAPTTTRRAARPRLPGHGRDAPGCARRHARRSSRAAQQILRSARRASTSCWPRTTTPAKARTSRSVERVTGVPVDDRQRPRRGRPKRTRAIDDEPPAPHVAGDRRSPRATNRLNSRTRS